MLGTIATSVARNFLRGAERLGLGSGELLRDAELAGDLLVGESRLPYARFDALWISAARRSGDPDFGPRVAALAQLGTHDILDYVMVTSPTLGDALANTARYFRVLNDAFAIDFVRDGDRAELVLDIPPGMACAAATEALLAVLLARVRLLAGDVRPLVRLAHAAGDPAARARAFAAPVVFGQPRSALVVAAHALGRPVHTADLVLHRILRRQADAELSRAPTDTSYTARVRRAVITELAGGDPSLRGLAARIGVGPRTIQRRLAREGTSHERILDDTRAELARAYVADPTRPLAEIAYLLGFSEPSAFHRAFRRWTGTTPSRVRQRLVGARPTG